MKIPSTRLLLQILHTAFEIRPTTMANCLPAHYMPAALCKSQALFPTRCYQSQPSREENMHAGQGRKLLSWVKKIKWNPFSKHTLFPLPLNPTFVCTIKSSHVSSNPCYLTFITNSLPNPLIWTTSLLRRCHGVLPMCSVNNFTSNKLMYSQVYSL